MLSTEENVKIAEGLLVKAAGAETARTLLASAQAQHEQILQEDAFQKSAEYQELLVLEQAEEFLKNASAEDRALLTKIATTHSTLLNAIEDPLEKMAYQQGAADAAMMMDSMGAAGEGQVMGPEEPMLPGAEDGPASIEQIAQVLEQAVAAGEISAEEAEAVLAALAGDSAGAADAGAEAEEVKAASALFKELVTDKATA